MLSTKEFDRGVSIIKKVKPFIQNINKTKRYFSRRLKNEQNEAEKDFFKGILHALKELEYDKKRNS